MPDPTLLEVQEALADAISDGLASEIPELQVVGKLVWNPTPPAVDIYPADPLFQEQTRFGAGPDTVYLAVRARVNTPDHDGAQELLLSLVDPRADTSLHLAATADRTLGGTVQDVWLEEGPSQYGIFTDPSGQGAFLGCTWTYRVTL